jgi:hypothetical protein
VWLLQLVPPTPKRMVWGVDSRNAQTNLIKLPAGPPVLNLERFQAHDVAQEAVAGAVKDGYACNVSPGGAEPTQACVCMFCQSGSGRWVQVHSCINFICS